MKETTANHERRVDPRIVWHAPAHIYPQGENSAHRGHIVDVSRGGSLIRSPIPLETGSGLELRIDLGELCLAPVVAEVKRSHPIFYGPGYLVAVEFREKNDILIEAVMELSEGEE